MDTTLEVPAGLLLLSHSPRVETTVPLSVDDARLPSPHSLERENTAEYPQATEGARVADSVGFPRTAA